MIFVTIQVTNRHFVGFHGSQFAAALSYSTLLAIVPMAALLFFFSLQLEIFSTLFDQVREQILLQLLPTIRNQVDSYLLQTTSNIKSFSYFGLGIFFISAIWLSLSIERALNHIWQVKTPRHLALRIPAHIILWLVAPFLIMLSITASTWLTSLPYISGFSYQVPNISLLFPWLISSAALFLLYYFVPNTHVHYRSAYLSALFSGLLFELSKWGFAFYITEYAMYEKIYGALSTLPIFMLWVFIAWTIVLWGAAFCVAIQSNKDTSSFLG